VLCAGVIVESVIPTLWSSNWPLSRHLSEWDIEEMLRQTDSQPGMTGRARIYALKHIAAALFILVAVGCSTVRLRTEPDTAYDPNQGTATENIDKNFPLHRGRWWDYYKRGCFNLERGRYEKAFSDFEQAIGKNNVDKRDTRTYGIHFIDYFPNRELGVVCCLQLEHETNVAKKEELFSKAKDHLKDSLNQEETSRAKFYLRRAAELYDRKPPLVWIENDKIDRWETLPTLYINRYEATLEIRASDDESFVDTVWCGGTRLFIESAEETFEQDTVVTVDPNDKEKTVVVKAVDLAGNASQPAVVRLIVDTVPPSAVAKVHADKVRLSLLGAHIPVDIFAEDDRGLKTVRVCGDPYDNRDCRGQVRWEGRFFAEPNDRSLTFEITDRAGNSTTLKAQVWNLNSP
jgi:hypothetical protein